MFKYLKDATHSVRTLFRLFATKSIRQPYTRFGTLIVATIYLQLIQNRYMFLSFTVLQCSNQHCGIRFRTVPEILQAVDRSIRTIITTGAAKGILRLPHRWQRVVHNAGYYIEGN